MTGIPATAKTKEIETETFRTGIEIETTIGIGIPATSIMTGTGRETETEAKQIAQSQAAPRAILRSPKTGKRPRIPSVINPLTQRLFRLTPSIPTD